MSWCPKCKMEYREGVTHCADCGTTLTKELVQETSLVEVMSTEQEELAERFLEFLKYSKVDSATLSYDNNQELYQISVLEPSYPEAKKLFTGFYLEEKEKQEKKDPKDEDVTPPKPTTTYIKKEDQFRDLTSTAYTFLFFGIGGLIFGLCNILGLIHFFQGYFSYIIMGIMFFAFVVIGFTTLKKAKNTKTLISEENQQIITLNTWLIENITNEFLSEIHNPSLSEEINYFHKIEAIKGTVTQSFPHFDEVFVDQMIEDFYNEHF